jgi:FkbM family methyltransferase
MSEREKTSDWRSEQRFLSFEERLKSALIPGPLYLRNLAARRLRRGERELHAVSLLAEPGMVALDIGANKGVYSYLLSRICRTVEAFEPNPKICELLRRCVPANVTVHEVALSNQSGMTEMLLPIHRTGRFSNQGGTLQSKKVEGKEFGTWPVEQRRLDDYNFTDVCFIKMDVEGFEFEVLEGAAQTLAREKPTLLIEIDEKQNKRPMEDSFKALADYGYDGYCMNKALHHIGRYKTADGFHPPGDNFIFFHRDG